MRQLIQFICGNDNNNLVPFYVRQRETRLKSIKISNYFVIILFFTSLDPVLVRQQTRQLIQLVYGNNNLFPFYMPQRETMVKWKKVSSHFVTRCRLVSINTSTN